MTTITNTPQFFTGKRVEQILDNYFRRGGFIIEPTSRLEEQVLCLGDRRFTSTTGESFYVEYKSGIQTFYTGNIFLETVSVDSVNKPGWVYTCQAELIFYAALLNQKILIFDPATLRAEIEALKARFGEVKTSKNQNRGYNTHGVLVPLDYAEKHLAKLIIRLAGVPS